MQMKADQMTISQINQRLIIDTIRKHHRITRAGLSQQLHLSPPSVSANVEKLLEKGILLEYAADEMTGPGRRGKLLGLNPEYRYLVCVDLSGKMMTVGLGTIEEEMVECVTCDRIEGVMAGQVIDDIKKNVLDLLFRNRLTMDRVGAVIICVPGIINENSGRIEHVSQFPGWDSLDAWNLLKQEYGSKLLLINDINASALGELDAGIGRYYSSFVYINIDIGVGGGVVINGHLLEGENLAAGSVGFMLTTADQLDGSRRKDRNVGDQVNVPVMRKRTADKLKIPENELTISMVNHLFRTGNPVVLDEITNLTKNLAMCIINICAVLNVPVVCLGGRIQELDVDLPRNLTRIVQNNLYYPPHVCFSQLGNSGAIRGAFRLGSEKILNFTLNAD